MWADHETRTLNGGAQGALLHRFAFLHVQDFDRHQIEEMAVFIIDTVLREQATEERNVAQEGHTRVDALT